MIIGSYLRALRVCSDEYLAKEESFIFESYQELKYPQYFILHAKKKAYTIFNTNRTPHPKPKTRPIFLPTNSISNTLVSRDIQPDMKIVNLTSKTIGNLIRKPTPSPTPTDGNIYQVPCFDCGKIYIGESARPLKTRLREHKNDIKFGDTRNAIFNHVNSTKHKPNFKDAKSLKFVHNKGKRKIIESAFILNSNTMKQKKGWYNLAPPIAKQIYRENQPHNPD